MKIKNIAVIFCLALIFPNCRQSSSSSGTSNTSNETTELKSFIDDFENKITEAGYFWQSGRSNTIDCSFKKDGTVRGIINIAGSPPRKVNGKWYFEKSTLSLQIAWEKDKHILVTLKKIEQDWNTIYFSDNIHLFGDDSKLTRMKLLDNRFE